MIKTVEPLISPTLDGVHADSDASDSNPWHVRIAAALWKVPPGNTTVQSRLIPLPLLLLLSVAVAALTARGAVTPNLPTMISVLIVGGFLCAEIGGIIPLFKRIGGPALTAAFLPSYAVSRHWLPKNLVDAITTFTTSTQFIYLFITAVVVGSILSMRRHQLISGMLKIFVPLIGASVVALFVGALTGAALHMTTSDALFMITIPVMAGGVGEGVLPLSTGYAQMRHMNLGVLIAQLLPVVLFGNLVSIVLAGILNALGGRFPHLTGNGILQPEAEKPTSKNVGPVVDDSAAGIDLRTVIMAALVCVVLYMLGVLCQSFTSFPGPVATLIFAVFVKLTGILPTKLDLAAGAVGRFFALAVTYPLLFAVAVAMTPWSAIVAALHPANLLLVVMDVSALAVSGFVLGRLMGLYPVETALINACHSGAGGTGAVAILTASNRMELMPFAQIATRIGGAITVALAFLAARWFGVW